ncbi:SDR family oxidoreductase [Methanogenium sp. S4BF]|uniref:dTDP-4-dehydrorhamnose reductase family protein n=1 Tax=Methanogenium sp. S4BF TaxID=1789226 RepID=UPI002416E5DB|nr:SDR family oxidoreductase [Methanogenium sp. S4BF]WFN34985.1 SDR family oxidoreductase [Methanogenium sp. S4BF]
MKILILGATGMLGHKLMQIFSKKYDVQGTVRKSGSAYLNHSILGQMSLLGDIRADDLQKIRDSIDVFKPNVVINCIGVVKQLQAAQDPISSININSLFPHQLAKICHESNVRLIHMSTDCVFSGKMGNYTENDPSDAEDLYGKTKYLGEVDYPGCLTLRTSIIGRELETSHGLLEWFLNQQGKTVSGYTKAIFSGFTTTALAKIIETIILDHPEMHGVWHVASDPISKYDLLTLINEIFGLKITLLPNDTVICDRSLNGNRFRQYTNIGIPSWPKMIEQIHEDPTPYHQ